MMALGTWLALVVLGITGADPGHLAALTAAILLATAVVLVTSVASIEVAVVQPTRRSSRHLARPPLGPTDCRLFQ
jgi:hypothetical protein